ncbi:acyl-coa-binding protein acbp [Holotrichia oblita]|uniref:Acyl-coa-binding protein acbp n=1 Tax=Holotrichia oblita TaxID=644536 RepID=A0ACB9T3C2_HOLOL|nr:acyl-coa-binding protein acbp [Holotrichia oblita]
MSLDERFKGMADKVRHMNPPSDSDSLELYSLFKQATVGDCNTERPGALDVKGKAKWDAWNGKKGVSQDEAKEKYITKGQSLGLNGNYKESENTSTTISPHLLQYKKSTLVDRPGMLDVKGKAKWDAWSAKKGMSKEDAQKQYIEKVEQLIASIGLQ